MFKFKVPRYPPFHGAHRVHLKESLGERGGREQKRDERVDPGVV